MYYKEDWQRAKSDLELFWNGEDIGRPIMGVLAPRTKDSYQFPELNNGPWTGSMDALSDDDTDAIFAWWTDPEENVKRMKFWFENTYFGGEAAPATYVNWGASAACAFFGSQPHFNRKSVWYSEVIRDWDEWKWKFDEKSNIWWNRILEIVRALAQDAPGRYLVGMPEFGNAADNLSLMRGMDNLSIDCIDDPDTITEAIDFMDGYWVKLHEQLYQMTRDINDGAVLPWLNLWAPGRIDQLACDFSSVLSPSMFEEIFFRDINTMGAWMEYGTYHLDGPICMKNMLDSVLKVDCIKAIEFTPGAGAPPTLTDDYIPKYRKILESGRRLYLLAQPEEVQPLCELLPRKGLYLNTYANSREEADELIKHTYEWSKNSL